jgi:glyoxylase-like metal-dependent hydrolase (beta-lactamase superfamily II)
MKIHTLDLNFLDKSNAIAAFLIESNQGHVLIECGPHSTFSILEQALLSKGLKVTDIKHVFLSHIHFDHAGAAWAFAQQGAKIYVHPKGLPHLAQPEKLYNSAKMIYGDKMEQLWGIMEPIEEANLIAPEHGEIFEVEGLKLTAWFTPGHASHHIAWEVVTPKSRCKPVLFAGDVAGVKIKNGLVVPPCPPPDIDIEKWLFSIELIKKLKPETLYLTHFGKITDKVRHLDELSQRLIEWSEWMKPHFEKQTPTEIIIKEFQEFVKKELLAKGINAKSVASYEAANPSFMAVAGLMRYWSKKNRE